MRYLYLSILFIYVKLAFCGGENFSVGGRSAGMAHASVTLSDLWSAHNNQAGLALLKHPIAGIYYENRYLIREMGLSNVAAALPVSKIGTFALSYYRFGSSLFYDSKVGLGYGMKLGEKISGGVQLNHHTIGFGDIYGKRSTVSTELGILAQLTNELSIGAHIYNINRARINNNPNEYLASYIRLGLNYKFSEQVFAVIEVQKDVHNKPLFKAAAEYKPADMLFIRAGISNNPLFNAFGFGLDLKNFKVDLAAAYHQQLGFSPQMSMVYEFAKNNKNKPVE
jgi:hypothetical protein